MFLRSINRRGDPGQYRPLVDISTNCTCVTHVMSSDSELPADDFFFFSVTDLLDGISFLHR